MTQGDKKSIGRISLQQRSLPADSGAARGAAKAIVRNAAEDLKALSERFGVPAIDLAQVCVRLADLELIPLEIARRHVILPVLVREERLFVAMANPHEKKVIDELEFVTDKKVFPYVAPALPLTDTIEQAYALRARDEEFLPGPACPPEVLRKARASRGARSSEPTAAAGATADSAVDEPAVVVDEKMQRVRDSDFPETDFGDLSKELSAVTEVPGGKAADVAPGVKTVLIVDDEPEIRQMLERLLRSKGYRVVSTDNGRTALAMVKEPGARPDRPGRHASGSARLRYRPANQGE